MMLRMVGGGLDDWWLLQFLKCGGCWLWLLGLGDSVRPYSRHGDGGRWWSLL